MKLKYVSGEKISNKKLTHFQLIGLWSAVSVGDDFADQSAWTIVPLRAKKIKINFSNDFQFLFLKKV